MDATLNLTLCQKLTRGRILSVGYLQDKVVAITGRGEASAAASHCCRHRGRTRRRRRLRRRHRRQRADQSTSPTRSSPRSRTPAARRSPSPATSARWRAAQAIVDAAMDTWGRIDGVVCVAGILRERMLFNMSEDEFDDVVRVHLKGTFTVFRAASAVMRKQEGGGSLIGFTSGVWALGSIAAGQLRGGQGRHRQPHVRGRARPRALRRARQLHRPGRPHPDERQRADAARRERRPRGRRPDGRLPAVATPRKDVTGQVYTVGRQQDRRVEPADRAAGDVQRRPLDARGDRRAAAGDGRDRAAAAARHGRGDARAAASRRDSRMPDDRERVELPRRRRRVPRAIVRDWLGRARRRRVRRRCAAAAAPATRTSASTSGSRGSRCSASRLDRPRLAGRARRPRRVGRRSRSSGPRSTPRAEAPARVNHMGENLLAPTLIEYGTAAAVHAVPARHPRRHRALVPGLQRARRRQRPRQRQDPRACSTATSG